MQTIRFLVFLLVCAITAPLFAAGPPPAFRAEYAVKKGPLELGRSVRELKQTPDGQFVFSSSSDTTGLADMLLDEHIRETARLRWNGQHLQPESYEYSRNGKRTRRISQAFDWQAGRMTGRLDERVIEYALPPVTYDSAGYQVSLMIDLADGVRDLEYSIASSKALSTWEIRHVGNEAVATPLGKLDTVVIQRRSDQVTTMWCAPSLHYLPVKIEHEENGMTFTARLQSVTGPIVASRAP